MSQKVNLLCNICQKGVRDPKMCPDCSQIFCSLCIKSFHQSSKCCFSCHTRIQYSKFVSCKCFLNYIYNNLSFKKLNKDQKQSRSLSQVQIPYQQKCQQHDISMKYYCEDCEKPICSDCGMISKKHKSHKFIHLNQIYSKVKAKLSRELDKLNLKILSYQQQALFIKNRMQKLQVDHEHFKRYTEEYFLLLTQKFQDQASNKNIFLKQLLEKNNKDVEFYQNCRDNICEQIQTKTRAQLISETQKLTNSFSMVIYEPPQSVQFQDTFETIKQIMPNFTNFQYTLYNFSLSIGIIYSEPFLLNGVQWRLKIYPKGNGVAKQKYLSVFVEMSKASSNHKKYVYKIELLNKQLPGQSIKRQYESSFDIGECWGYNQFVPLQELQTGFLSIDDSLSFIMGIRNSQYKSLSTDQRQYIDALQAQLKVKQAQLKEQTNIIDQNEVSSPYHAFKNQMNATKKLKISRPKGRDDRIQEGNESGHQFIFQGIGDLSTFSEMIGSRQQSIKLQLFETEKLNQDLQKEQDKSEIKIQLMKQDEIQSNSYIKTKKYQKIQLRKLEQAQNKSKRKNKKQQGPETQSQIKKQYTKIQIKRQQPIKREESIKEQIFRQTKKPNQKIQQPKQEDIRLLSNIRQKFQKSKKSYKDEHQYENIIEKQKRGQKQRKTPQKKNRQREQLLSDNIKFSYTKQKQKTKIGTLNSKEVKEN